MYLESRVLFIYTYILLLFCSLFIGLPWQQCVCDFNRSWGGDAPPFFKCSERVEGSMCVRVGRQAVYRMLLSLSWNRFLRVGHLMEWKQNQCFGRMFWGLHFIIHLHHAFLFLKSFSYYYFFFFFKLRWREASQSAPVMIRCLSWIPPRALLRMAFLRNKLVNTHLPPPPFFLKVFFQCVGKGRDLTHFKWIASLHPIESLFYKALDLALLNSLAGSTPATKDIQ